LLTPTAAAAPQPASCGGNVSKLVSEIKVPQRQRSLREHGCARTDFICIGIYRWMRFNCLPSPQIGPPQSLLTGAGGSGRWMYVRETGILAGKTGIFRFLPFYCDVLTGKT
jgi:hypothetical protein